LASFVAFAETK